jgi:hypothetical protein
MSLFAAVTASILDDDDKDNIFIQTSKRVKEVKEAEEEEKEKEEVKKKDNKPDPPQLKKDQVRKRRPPIFRLGERKREREREREIEIEIEIERERERQRERETEREREREREREATSNFINLATGLSQHCRRRQALCSRPSIDNAWLAGCCIFTTFYRRLHRHTCQNYIVPV